MPDDKPLDITIVPTLEVSKVDTPIADVSLDPMDFQKEIKRIAEEKGVEIKADGSIEAKDAPIIEQAQEPQAAPQPEIPPAEAQPEVKVPDKFKDESGKPDEAKIQKSTLSAEQALKKYVELEKELRKKQSEVQKLKTQDAPILQAQPSQHGQDLEQLIAKDLQDNQANPAKVLAKWAYAIEQASAARAEQAKKEALEIAMGEVSQFRQEAAYRKMQEELSDIAKNDPWVLSEEGVNSLMKMREENPHINQLPNPWSEAYDKYLASQVKIQRSAQTGNITTPKRPTAPPTPVGQSARSSSQKTFSSRAELNTYLDSLDQKGQDAFWAKALKGY